METADRGNVPLLMLCGSLVYGAILLGLPFVRWELIELLTPFLEPLWVELPAHASFLAMLLWSAVYAPRALRRRQRAALLALGVNLATIAAVLLIPFGQIVVALDFRVHRAERERVVADVVSGTLQPNVGHSSAVIRVPPSYGRVSKGDNEIIVERDGGGLSITFFTVRGIVDNWSGFIYRSDGHSPTEADIGGLILELIKLDDHWYWIATT